MFTSPLEDINIASPCTSSWENMIGNDKKRYCGECRLNVYNLSGLTRDQAEDLIMSSEGRLCVRFFRRTDGSVITEDCPVGWQRLKRRMSRFWTATASLIFAFLGGTSIASYFNEGKSMPISRISIIERQEIVGAMEALPEKLEPEMGKVVLRDQKLRRNN